VDDELLRALARTQKRHAGPDAPMDTTADRVEQPASPIAELVAPFGPEERAAMLDAVFARVDAEARAPETLPIGSISNRSRGRTAAIVSAVVAVAAALVLWVALPRTSEPQLPSYALTELRGGASSMRGDPGSLDHVVELNAGEEIEITMTPASATRVPLVVDVIAEAQGHEPTMARVPAIVSASGAVRIAGSPTEWLGLAPGSWRITVSVAPVDQAPATTDEALGDERLRRVSFDLRIAADG
jgi:hypothetical protein